jgi:hypothetical protein
MPRSGQRGPGRRGAGAEPRQRSRGGPRLDRGEAGRRRRPGTGTLNDPGNSVPVWHPVEDAPQSLSLPAGVQSRAGKSTTDSVDAGHPRAIRRVQAGHQRQLESLSTVSLPLDVETQDSAKNLKRGSTPSRASAGGRAGNGPGAEENVGRLGSQVAARQTRHCRRSQNRAGRRRRPEASNTTRKPA